ncbi:collagen-binding domain-containing protein [Bdellovibrio sp. HCB337]|uniref:collagen-binding domain-containing protein n=1 Tax=Bdellovibrio sp. HCB337 TaxID=3394358 RepID=UPI0039A72957
MYKLSAGLIAALFVQSMAFAASSTICKTPSLYDFTVYSIGNIDVQQSDYQGLTGSGGSILAINFQFNSNPETCLAVSVAKDLGISSSAINGNTEAQGTAGLRSVGARGDVVARKTHFVSTGVRGKVVTKNPSFRVNHADVIEELIVESSKLAHKSSTGMALNRADALVLDLKSTDNVIYILHPSVINEAKRIIINGNPSSKVVINVPGEDIRLKGQDVMLLGDVNPANITWNFYQAKNLHISKTHNALYGMPGIVMAPLALVEFHEALITGALYAGSIVTSLSPFTDLNAGQVNRDVTDNPLAPPPPPEPPPVFPE